MDKPTTVDGPPMVPVIAPIFWVSYLRTFSSFVSSLRGICPGLFFRHSLLGPFQEVSSVAQAGLVLGDLGAAAAGPAVAALGDLVSYSIRHARE